MSSMNPLAHARGPLAGAGASASVVPVASWALLGLLATIFSFSVFGAWMADPAAFAAVPIREADAMAGNGVLLIRLVELVSTCVALWAIWHYLVRPWVRTGTPPITGLVLVGALISYVLDTMVNYNDYWMAWNKHALNWGTWAASFPGHTGPTRYAEALLWGPSMYLYFGVALATMQLWIFDRVKPRVGMALALVIVYAAAFVFDLVAETTIIRMEAYAWPTTIGALTLWKGSQFQFPLYESVLVGFYATFYMLLLRSARDNAVSFIERGVDRVPGGLRLPVRLLAATGFAAACTFFYFGGFVLISQYADHTVTLPSYLMHDGR